MRSTLFSPVSRRNTAVDDVLVPGPNRSYQSSSSFSSSLLKVANDSKQSDEIQASLENHSSSFDKVARIHGKRCKCVTNFWETLQCILKQSTALNEA